jgi:hypothetical protein
VSRVEAQEADDASDDLNDEDLARRNLRKMSSIVLGQIEPEAIVSMSRLTKFWQLFVKKE